MQTFDAALPNTEGNSQQSRQPMVAEAVIRALRQDHILRCHNISCQSYEGILILRGCVATYYMKQLIQTLAAQVEGVQQIDNRVEVAAPCSAAGRRTLSQCHGDERGGRC